MAETEQEQQPLSIYITGGATGAGLALARAAARKGYKVFAATDKGTVGAYRLREIGALPLYTDFSRAGDIKSALALAKADIVVNCAPQALNGLPQHAFEYAEAAQAVVDGTQNIVAVAAEMGVKRVIHLSPAYLYGDTGGSAVAEDHAISTRNSLFAKLAEAETAVLDSDIAGYVVRAGVIYGGSHDAMATMAEALLRGRSMLNASGQASYIHEADLAELLLQIVEQEFSDDEAKSTVFNAGGSEPTAHNDFLSILSEAYGVGTPSYMMELMMNFRTDELQRTLLAQNTVIDSSKAQATFGWEANYSIEAGIDHALLVWRAAEAPDEEPAAESTELAKA